MARSARLPLVAGGAALLICGGWLLADRLEDTIFIPLDHPAIQYAAETTNPVARLAKRLDSGQVNLDYSPVGGYLAALLKELAINVDSQVLVFSRTSIQGDKISPRTPRAIYFSDDASVGFVQNGQVLEITSVDPKQGVVLYSLNTARVERPGLARRDDCLSCHQGPVTLAVPGLLVSSVHPSNSPGGDGHGSAFMTDHRTAFGQRWGGWYVTGTHGGQYHLGNNPNLADPIHPGPALREGTQNVTDLSSRFDTSRYLAQTSDLVALLVLEHQVRMTNLMTRIGWDMRIAERDGTLAAQSDQLNAEMDELVAYMLFGDEDPLKEPVAGVSTFSKTFPERGPRDKQGRTLRDFDLKTRLFRYPLSYMIYSAAFDGMPEPVRARVYQRLYDILTNKDTSKSVADLSLENLTEADRRAILEIVRETKPKLPSYWTAGGAK